jgi:RND family efflux transporter MFP subunit
MKTITSLLPSLPIFALALVLLSACSQANSPKTLPAATAPIPVEVVPLRKIALNQPITTSGQFFTDDEATLSFKTGGVVARVLVKEGDPIRKGQLLAVLDLTEIQAQVNQARLGYEKAKRDLSRAQHLYRDSVVTLEQLQNARTAAALAREQDAAARFNLSFSQIRAAADGYVLKKFVNAGQVVSSGAAVIRTNGAGKASWVFKAGLSDKEWAALEPGDAAAIRTDAVPGQDLAATVTRKSEGADPLNGAFTVELAVAARPGYRLASGLFGTATLWPARKTALWQIPHEALLDGNANQGFVFVTFDNKTARKIPVTIATIDNEAVRISGGLEEARSLITRGSAYLTDQSAITIIK